MINETTYGPGDTVCVAVVPGQHFVLEEVQDFSVSTHVDKIPVRTVGHRLVQGWATGFAMVAGTIVCAGMKSSALYKLRRYAAAHYLIADRVRLSQSTEPSSTLDSVHLDTMPIVQQLPPFHLIFFSQNDSGDLSVERLYNVTISDHGQVRGASNSYAEETLTYQAIYYEPPRLRRTMSIESMQEEIGKTSEFFYSYRGMSEPDIALPVTGESGAGDLGGALARETEIRIEQDRQGITSASVILDRGLVLGQPVRTGTAVAYLDNNGDTNRLHGQRISIQDRTLVTTGGLGNVPYTLTVNGRNVLHGDTHLGTLVFDEDGDGSITLTAADYAALVSRSSGTLALQPLLPFPQKIDLSARRRTPVIEGGMLRATVKSDRSEPSTIGGVALTRTLSGVTIGATSLAIVYGREVDLGDEYTVLLKPLPGGLDELTLVPKAVPLASPLSI